MKKTNNINYNKGIIIAHGKSEVLLGEHIKSNLHLPIKIYSKKNGKLNIQVNGLLKELNNTIFKNKSCLLNRYLIEQSGKDLKNFFVMPIMDIDDCDEATKEAYISKTMFKSHWLYPYIIPVWNTPDLDHVLYNLGLIDKIPNENEKGEVYSKLFPINHKEKDIDQVLDLEKLFKKSKETNMEIFIEECLKNIK